MAEAKAGDIKRALQFLDRRYPGVFRAYKQTKPNSSSWQFACDDFELYFSDDFKKITKVIRKVYKLSGTGVCFAFVPDTDNMIRKEKNRGRKYIVLKP